MKKSKLQLLLTLSIALLSVFSIGVSTYAWFASSAQATASVDGDDATITAIAPEGTLFWAYKGNTQDWDYTGTLTDDFVLVTESNKNEQANLIGMVPGDVMTFVLEVPSVTTSVNLGIKKLISNDSARQGLLQNRYVADGTGNVFINVGWAFDIYSFVNTTGTNYTDFLADPTLDDNEDKFDYAYNKGRSTLETGFDGTTKIKTFADNAMLPIASYVGAANRVYLFYTIIFSNDSNTLYKEVESKAVDAAVISDVPNDGDRFFKKDGSGKSNCYGGLKFALPEIKIIKV